MCFFENENFKLLDLRSFRAKVKSYKKKHLLGPNWPCTLCYISKISPPYSRRFTNYRCSMLVWPTCSLLMICRNSGQRSQRNSIQFGLKINLYYSRVTDKQHSKIWKHTFSVLTNYLRIKLAGTRKSHHCNKRVGHSWHSWKKM